MRSRLEWLIVAALVALAVAATLDAVLSASGPGGERRSATREATTAAEQEAGATTSEQNAAAASLPPCGPDQLRLSIDVFTENPFIALRHGEGDPCHLAAVPVELTVVDRDGKRVRLATSPTAVSDDLAPGYVRLLGITYLPSCGLRPPFTATVKVDGQSARRELPPVGCTAESA